MPKLWSCISKRSESIDDIDARPLNNNNNINNNKNNNNNGDKIIEKPKKFSSLSRGFIKPPTRKKFSISTNQIFYKNDHPNIGIALIFTHINVPGYEKRAGAEIDQNNMENILKLYGFDVRVYVDLSYDSITAILTEVSEEDHSKNDCLMVVVMSHGYTGYIHSSDMPYPVDHLWIPFMGENCPSLINKPKLFFIQACRNRIMKADVGAVYTTTCSGSEKCLDHDEVDCQVTYTIPSTADTLLFYATFDGFVSFRNKTQGSWFIESIAHTLEHYLKTEEYVNIFNFLTAVNRKVAYEYQSNMPSKPHLHEMKAMPSFVSTLTKLFIFTAKVKTETSSVQENEVK